MQTYLRAEIDGEAQSCARFTDYLREKFDDLLIDQQGYLLIPMPLWSELTKLASKFQCLMTDKDQLSCAA